MLLGGIIKLPHYGISPIVNILTHWKMQFELEHTVEVYWQKATLRRSFTAGIVPHDHSPQTSYVHKTQSADVCTHVCTASKPFAHTADIG